MITTLPVTTAEIVNAVLPRNAAAKGVVAGKIASDVYVIALSANGKIALKVPSGDLSEGDSVALFSRGDKILVEKIPPQASQTPSRSAAADTVNVQTAPDSAALKLLADTAAEQLKKQVIDKDTLDQLQRILAAVAKNPQRFGEDTVNAVADLKAIVAAMPSGGDNVEQTAQEVADRIIKLGDKFAEKLKNAAGAVDVILRNGTKAQEGYYSFDNVKSAISWLSENKEIQENVPWQKLTQMFGSGPVVIKIYESAIGDMRASFIPPQQTGDELSHFAASTLRADVWKDVSGNVLTNVLYDRKEIPLSRLLALDALLKESEQQPSEPAPPSAQAAGAQSPALRSKGYEAALSQWLTIALDKNAPVQQLISRVPQPSAQQIPSLLSTLDDVNHGQETTFIKQIRADDFSIQQETLSSAERPDTVLPDMFKRLGLNLEASLSRGDDAATEMHPQSLKAVLLSLLGAIESASGQAQDGPSTVLSAVDTAAALDQERAAVAAAQNIRLSVSNVSSTLKEIFNAAAEQAKFLSAQAHEAESAASPENGTDAPRQLLDKIKLIQDMPARIDSLVQSMLKTAASEVERLVIAFQKVQNVVSAEKNQPLTDITKGAYDTTAVNETSAQLEAAALKAVNTLEQEGAAVLDAVKKFTVELSEKVNTLAQKSFAGPPDLSTEKQLAAVLKEVKQEINSFVKALPDEIAAMVRQSSEGLAAAQKDLAAAGMMSGPSAAAASDEATPEPVLSLVARDIATTVKLLDTLGIQTADESATQAVLSTVKHELNEVLSRLNLARAEVESFSAKTGLPSFPVDFNAEHLDNLTRTMNNGQAMLVRRNSAGLNQDIGRLTEQIEQLPAAGGAASRRETVTRLLSEFAANVSGRVKTLVGEAGAQMMDYATKSSETLKTAASQPAETASPGKQVDTMQAGDARTVAVISTQLEKAAQDIQAALSRLEAAAGNGDIPGRAEQLVRLLQKSIASAADSYLSRMTRDSQEKTGDAMTRPDTRLENLAAAAGRQIMAKVNGIADRLQDLSRQVRQLEGRIPSDAAQLQAKQQADAVQSSLKEIFKQLDSLARMVSDQALSASRETARHLDNLASEASKRVDSLASDTDPGQKQQRGGLDMLKQQVESALTHVESLQVLAHQVSVTDGQQQVISLPMKIEGQWTDVVVKFLKKKDSAEKKNASNRPVSVAIHVSPAMLGQIDVFMDYNGTKHFRMRMEFEKPSTRAWFEKNKADFSGALERIGFTAFKIDMNEIRHLRRSRDIVAAAAARKIGGSAQGVIDITA